MHSLNFKQRKQRWEQINKKYKKNSAREATFILTVENTLRLLKAKKQGRLLDIGCGFGEIDVLLAQNTDFNIIGCDISELALRNARENVEKMNLSNRVKIEQGDVYKLKYPDNFFDVVLSFGYVSAATYIGAQKEVVRVLKPGGILICDFIHCLSPYKLFYTLKRIIKVGEIPYYISLAGIRREFKKENLIVTDQCFFNTYLPLDLKLDPKVFLAFENIIGRLFRNFLGRVRLVKFQKIK
jgi:ubiquinone/menaquinone biosynthesis C-methylase UbiE